MRTLTLALILLSCSTAMSQESGLVGAVDGADRMNNELARRNGLMLDRGKHCASLVREGKLAPGAMAQYRCILSGGGIAGAADAGPPSPAPTGSSNLPAGRVGPKAPPR